MDVKRTFLNIWVLKLILYFIFSRKEKSFEPIFNFSANKVYKERYFSTEFIFFKPSQDENSSFGQRSSKKLSSLHSFITLTSIKGRKPFCCEIFLPNYRSIQIFIFLLIYLHWFSQLSINNKDYVTFI